LIVGFLMAAPAACSWAPPPQQHVAPARGHKNTRRRYQKANQTQKQRSAIKSKKNKNPNTPTKTVALSNLLAPPVQVLKSISKPREVLRNQGGY
jgi:hypothetical protein